MVECNSFAKLWSQTVAAKIAVKLLYNNDYVCQEGICSLREARVKTRRREKERVKAAHPRESVILKTSQKQCLLVNGCSS